MKKTVKLENDNKVRYVLNFDTLSFDLKVTLEYKMSDINYYPFVERNFENIDNVEKVEKIIEENFMNMYDIFKIKYDQLKSVGKMIDKIKTIEINDGDKELNDLPM